MNESVYAAMMEQVKESARKVVLAAHGHRGMASVDTSLVLELSRAIIDADLARSREKESHRRPRWPDLNHDLQAG